MEVENTLHMNVGDGESSYASNSFLQETAIRKSLQVLQHTIKGMVNIEAAFSKVFVLADLGCGTGKNTLLLASMVIDLVLKLCKENNHKAPQFQVFLNDLFGNDFNTIFQLLPKFTANLKKEKGENFWSCFVSANPGSFYGRLFPDESLHFVHSSYALHWLSQVPKGIENNKENIYMAKSSPLNVLEAYQSQFQSDFIKFLQMRSNEVVHGGCMVLTFRGRSSVDLTTDDGGRIFELIAQSLLNMVEEGLVQESYLHSFNVPNYAPCKDELMYIIHNEGSFSLDTLIAFQVNWDPYDTDYTNVKDLDEQSHIHGKNCANVLRAVYEPLLTSHFGNLINIDVLFQKFQNLVAEDLANKKTRHFNIVVSLTRK
ncbi:unnamed protein product [Lactuca saligna]|uniref:Uncharacterized protein n=1 Tax=Lactuca saligna TaxID=75948 RepID=A0AA35ZHM9_LACSI|nr:unnamed protein product [Lactuca saligna]